MKLYEYLTRYGREAGSRLFYRDDEGSLTYGEALGEARRWADFFTAQGAKRKVAAFRGDNPKDQLLFFLGAEMAGARPVLIHEYLKERDLAGLFAKRPIDIFFSDRDYPTLSMKQEGHFYIRDLGAHGGGAGDFGVLTSGSSGLPKVLFRRDESWSDFFSLQNTIFEVGPTSGLFVQGSLAFTGNLNMVMGFLSAGASIHLSRRLLPRTWMKRIAEEAVTHVYMIPSKLSPLSKSRGQAEGLAYIHGVPAHDGGPVLPAHGPFPEGPGNPVLRGVGTFLRILHRRKGYPRKSGRRGPPLPGDRRVYQGRGNPGGYALRGGGHRAALHLP